MSSPSRIEPAQHAAPAHIDLDCGISYARIASWLETQLPTVAEGDSWVFHADGSSCLIRTEALEPRSFGTISLERTRLTVDGDWHAVDEFHRLFALQFYSAGG